MSNTNRGRGAASVQRDEMPQPMMCCRKITVTTMRVPPAAPDQFACRMLYFLCSYWAGKWPEKDTGSEPLCAANFSGVIRLCDVSPPQDPNATGPTFGGYAPTNRWLACYSPGHPKASKIAPIGNKGTGPEGKYMEISDAKALNEIAAGRLAHSYFKMQYGNCTVQGHAKKIYLGRWFEFRDPDATLESSSRLVINGVLKDLEYTGPRGTQACSRCRGARPSLEYRVNIFNSSGGPKFCLVCQRYRRWNEPTRKSRAKSAAAGSDGRTGIEGSGSVDNNPMTDSSGIVDNSLIGGSSGIIDNAQTLGGSAIIDNALGFGNGTVFDNNQLSDSSGPVDTGYFNSAQFFDSSGDMDDFECLRRILGDSLDSGNTPTFDDTLTFDNTLTFGSTQTFDNYQVSYEFDDRVIVGAGQSAVSEQAINTSESFVNPNFLIDPRLRADTPPGPQHVVMDEKEHDDLYTAD